MSMMKFSKLQRNLAFTFSFLLVPAQIFYTLAFAAELTDSARPPQPVASPMTFKNTIPGTTGSDPSFSFFTLSTLSNFTRKVVTPEAYDETQHTAFNSAPRVETSGGNTIDGRPPGYVRFHQFSEDAYQYRYNLKGSRTAFVKNRIVFDHTPADLTEGVTLGLQGPAGVRVNVTVTDTKGNAAYFVLDLTGQFQNYTLPLKESGDHRDVGFDRSRIVSIDFEVNRQVVPNRSQWVDFIRVRTRGLFYENVAPTAFDASRHTDLGGVPSVEAFGGNPFPNRPPGYVRFKQFSRRNFKTRYNIWGSEPAFVTNRLVFDPTGSRLPEFFEFGLKGPAGITVVARVMDAEGRRAVFKLEMTGEFQNYVLPLDPERANVDAAFDRSKVTVIEFEVNRQGVPRYTQWIGFLEFRMQGLKHFVPDSAFDESLLSVHPNRPVVTGGGGNAVDGRPPGFVQLKLLSDRELEYVYHVKSSKTAFAYAQLKGSSPADFGGQFVFAARGPEATLMRVEFTDTHQLTESFDVVLHPVWRNYTITLTPDAVASGFDVAQITAIRFVHSQGLVGTRQQELVKIRTPGLAFTPLPPLAPDLVRLRSDLIQKGLSYFQHGIGVDPVTRFPFDSVAENGVPEKLTQPTLIGFYFQILAAIVAGDISDPAWSVDQALEEMSVLLKSLETLQRREGWKGLIPWFDLDGPHRDRDFLFHQVATGDNANLAQSLAVAAGALEKASLTLRQRTIADALVAGIDRYLDAMEPGFAAMVDEATGLFRLVYRHQSDNPGFEGYMDRLFNEFRGAVAFVVARYDSVPATVWNGLEPVFRTYTHSWGGEIQNAAPWDGGAFQVFWPSLRNRETDFYRFRTVLWNHFVTQTDFAARYKIPGFLSASLYNTDSYSGRIGIPSLAESGHELVMDIGSTYPLAAAYHLAPETVLEWLRAIRLQLPNLEGAHGFYDAARSNAEIAKRYLGIDIASTVLGLSGAGPDAFEIYLRKRGLELPYNLLYDQAGKFQAPLRLAPKALVRPPATDFPKKSLAVFSHLATSGEVGTFPPTPTEPWGLRYQYGDLLNPATGKRFGGKFWMLKEPYDASGGKLRLRFSLIDSPVEIKVELKSSTGELVFADYFETLPGFPWTDLVIQLPASPLLRDVREVLLLIDQDRSGDLSGNFYLHAIQFSEP